MYTVSRKNRHVGDVVFMDEYVGARRVRLTGVVVDAAPGKRLVWQLKAGIRLPVWLSLDFADGAAGVTVTHRTRAGWAGWGRLFDPLFRLYFSRSFAAALDAHILTEFRLLGERLRATPTTKNSSAFDVAPLASPAPESARSRHARGQRWFNIAK
jgi:hypothetical protein